MITIDANGITLNGLIGDPIGTGTTAPIYATPPATMMTFPYTYGSSVLANTSIEIRTTGAAVGQPGIDSVIYKSYLNFDASVIASGDMILPIGTLSALLERRINTSVDTAWAKGPLTGGLWIIPPGFPVNELDSSFYWYSDQSLEKYAHALYDSTGLHDVVYFKEQVMVGINETASQTKKVNVYPNPTHNFLGVSGVNLPAAKDWSIYNSEGALVLKGNFNLKNINVEDLKQGNYFLHLQTVSGEKHIVQFIKY
jgi:hypothetical protein